MKNEEYIKYVEKTSPKTNELKTILTAFCVGGVICIVGQIVSDMLSLYLTNINSEQNAQLTTIIMIFIGSFLTGIGVYDKIGYYAGAGSILPITGFANSIVSPAMEFNKEGVIYGIMAKMFVIAGPVIVSGVCASVGIGVIFSILKALGVSI